jgi:hypothetical protein
MPMPNGGTLKFATRNMSFADGDANAPQGRPGRYIALQDGQQNRLDSGSASVLNEGRMT